VTVQPPVILGRVAAYLWHHA